MVGIGRRQRVPSFRTNPRGIIAREMIFHGEETTLSGEPFQPSCSKRAQATVDGMKRILRWSEWKIPSQRMDGAARLQRAEHKLKAIDSKQRADEFLVMI